MILRWLIRKFDDMMAALAVDNPVRCAGCGGDIQDREHQLSRSCPYRRRRTPLVDLTEQDVWDRLTDQQRAELQGWETCVHGISLDVRCAECQRAKTPTEPS